MNPPASTTVVGDLTTTWRRFAAVTIVTKVNVIQPEGVAMLRQLTDPRLLPTRFHLFRRGLVLVARDHIRSRQGDNFRKNFMPFCEKRAVFGYRKTSTGEGIVQINLAT